MVHFAPEARLVPQVLVWAKSPPGTMLEMLNAVVWLLVMLTAVAALVEPTF
jgi:hypothetical protein